MNTADFIQLVVLGLCWVGAMGGIGYVIGRAKNNGAFGFCLGLLIGPLGWLIIAILPAPKSAPDDGPLIKCPECLGEVPAIARQCRHCGSVIS